MKNRKEEVAKQYASKEIDEIHYKEILDVIDKQIAEKEQDTVTKFGFIAQELREVYPNLVFEDNEGYLKAI